MKRGDLAGALVQWKILRLVEPDDEDHARREEATRKRIDQGVQERLALGEAALQRGDPSAAGAAFLRALALDPHNVEAAGRLREIEKREVADRKSAKATRNGRKPSAKVGSRPRTPAPDDQESYYLETGLELLRQGDYGASVVELEKYVRSYPEDRGAKKALSEARLKWGQALLRAGDAAAALRQLEEARENGGNDRAVDTYARQAKKQLAEDLYEKGVRASRADLAKAIEYWRQCLVHDPGHLGARSQLDKAVRMQERLRKIR